MDFSFAFFYRTDPTNDFVFSGEIDTRETRARNTFFEFPSSRLIAITEEDTGALRGKSANRARSNSIRTASQQDDFLLKIVIYRHFERLIKTEDSSYSIRF